MIDFKVFHGSTSGERIHEDQKSILEEFSDKPFVVMGVTDTTGSMGVLGRLMRDEGYEHGYCSDHNFHLNAILAFNGMCHAVVICLIVMLLTHLNITFHLHLSIQTIISQVQVTP